MNLKQETKVSSCKNPKKTAVLYTYLNFHAKVKKGNNIFLNFFLKF